MFAKRLQQLFTVTIIVMMMFSTSMAQALSAGQEDPVKCPPYDPRLAGDEEFLRQLPAECQSAYEKVGSSSPQFTSSPDAYGYIWDDSVTPTWIDTTAGTNTGLSGYGGVTGAIGLPFTFQYYDNEFDFIRISSYGYVTFNNDPIDTQDNIPSSHKPNNVIAPWWTPTYIKAGTWVHYLSGGTVPNRYFVVEWHNLTGPNDGYGNDDHYLFEVILHENGNIEFQYSTNSVAGVWYCGSAGIENSTGLVGLKVRDLCHALPPSNYAVLFTRPATGSFLDVSTYYWAYSYIERLYNAGITGGCNLDPLKYCPETTVNRAQMAVFLLRGIHGSSYTPPPVGASTGFGDVPTNYWAAAWIKELAAEGITGGCGNGNYCPETAVTRDQMAVFLLRSEHGAAYSPPAVVGGTGFADVPDNHWAAAWIKQLVTEGITAGCGGGNYCPNTVVNRAQMAVFLVRTFALP